MTKEFILINDYLLFIFLSKTDDIVCKKILSEHYV